MTIIITKIVSRARQLVDLEMLDMLLFSLSSLYLSIVAVSKNTLNKGAYGSWLVLVLIAGMACLLIKHASSKLLIVSVAVSSYYAVANSYITLAINKNNSRFTISNRTIQELLLSLAALVSLLILGVLLKKYLFKKDYQSNRGIQVILLSQAFSVLTLNSSLFKTVIKQNDYWPLDSQSNLVSLNLFKYSFCSYMLMFVVYYLIVTAFIGALSKRWGLRLALVTSLFLGIIFNYYIQAGITAYGDFHGAVIIPGATLFQVLVLTLFFALVFLLINNYIIALFVNTVIGALISIVNIEKYKQRSEPLLFSDLKWIKEIKFFLNYISLTQLISIIFILVLSGLLIYILYKRYFRERILPTLYLRLISIGSILLVFVSIIFVFSQNKDGEIKKGIPVLSSVYNVFDIDWYGLTTNARFQSLSFVWFKQVTTSTINQPSGYSKSAMQKIYQKYQARAADINKQRHQRISDQTVIYILSESFADPARISGVQLAKDPIPEIHHIMETTTSGLMTSDGYGGGTANMEFQSLFGLPKYNLNPTVSILYSDVFPKLKYSPAISNAFSPKDRIALHLASANNYSRKIVYNKLGFETFIATEDSVDKPKHLVRMSSSYSDESTYDNILDQLNPKRSQFFSVITMQNHGPWYTELRDVDVSLAGLDGSETDSLQSYVNLLSITDKSTKAFLSALEKVDKPITVVFYGDHLPGFYPDQVFKNDEEIKYLTDYFIWSNHQANKLARPRVNSSDFTSLLLEHTNSKVSPYYALLTDVLDTRNSDDSQLTATQKQVASDLKLLEYDLIEGKGYINAYPDFFNMK
ncbi:TPA: sulfatase-like hydrolase/transferase [Streptococcus equi subsp. zooepidemicus]